MLTIVGWQSLHQITPKFFFLLRCTEMAESVDREKLEQSVRLVVEFGEFQYQTLEDRYLRNITALPWSKNDIIDAIKDVVFNVNDESTVRAAIAQLQCLAGFQDFFNDEEEKVLIDDLFDNKATHLRDNRALLERFKEEMLMMIELSEKIESIVFKPSEDSAS
jgi:hypothetical protein